MPLDSAFPLATSDRVWDDGMSLRDYFAGQALVGMGTWMPNTTNGLLRTRETLQARAIWAYAQADAMLDARYAVGGSKEP